MGPGEAGGRGGRNGQVWGCSVTLRRRVRLSLDQQPLGPLWATDRAATSGTAAPQPGCGREGGGGETERRRDSSPRLVCRVTAALAPGPTGVSAGLGGAILKLLGQRKCPGPARTVVEVACPVSHPGWPFHQSDRLSMGTEHRVTGAPRGACGGWTVHLDEREALFQNKFRTGENNGKSKV